MIPHPNPGPEYIRFMVSSCPHLITQPLIQQPPPPLPPKYLYIITVKIYFSAKKVEGITKKKKIRILHLNSSQQNQIAEWHSINGGP